MKIEGSIEEIKLLFKNFELKAEKKTSAAGTTDELLTDKQLKQINDYLGSNY